MDRVIGTKVHVVPIEERFAYFTAPGRNRKVIRTDLDQAHFLMGAAFPDSGLKIDGELSNPNFRVKRSVDEILKWDAESDKSSAGSDGCKDRRPSGRALANPQRPS